MQSMTGFGRAELTGKPGRLTVEIASVNNRFLEFTIRLPKPYISMEPRIREYLMGVLSRGKITVTVTLEERENSPDKYTINEQAVRSYVKKLRRLQDELNLGGTVSISDVVMLPDALRPKDTDIDLESLWVLLERGLKRSVTELLAMRSREGRAMSTDMRARLKALSVLIRRVEQSTINSSAFYAQKLTERIRSLLHNSTPDASRLEQEIAYFADKTDVAEECVRFKSHLRQYRETLKEKNAIGRRLNFILQELNREANTIGSKGCDFDIFSTVISLKEEVEKLRELVQNVE